MTFSWDQVESNRLVAWMNSASEAALGWRLPDAVSMYRPGVSHLPFIATSVVLYFVAVFGFRSIVRRSSFDLRKSAAFSWFAFCHNIFMSLFSLYMFIDVIWKLYEHNGMSSYDAYIRVGPAPAFQAVQDLFYWSKFLELIDTFVLVARHKELGTLHLFHHATTASVSYVTRNQPLWMGTWTNGLVHVFMYAHFAKPINFVRKYLTTLQILQFICVLWTYQDWWINHSDLTFMDALWPNFCYCVYLVFFCKFFIDNYITRPRTAKHQGTVYKKEQ